MTSPLALDLAHTVADLLADPETAPFDARTATADRQHLAHGLSGIALLHIERAAADLGPWQRAHDWLSAAARQPFTSGPDSHPFYGAPAFAHALSCVAEHLPGSYQRALDTLDAQMAKDICRRLGAAQRRIDAGELPLLAEFDVIRGLTGYGAQLLRRSPASAAMRSVLDYCVRLTEPVSRDGEHLPGWWTPTGPSGRSDDRFPGGHANTGVAHGIGGVLALLAPAARHGTLVDGHHEAMRAILAWLSGWQVETGRRGPAWPYWVTRTELREGHLAPTAPQRPSWCYGTAGLARAQQLAALALGDTGRQVEAENALVNALTDPVQLKATTDNGLCHGFAGLAHVTARTADDAHPSTVGQLRAAIPPLLTTVCPPGTDPAHAATAAVQDQETGVGFLNGAAGIALALLAPATATPPRSPWDSCLLIA
ncbi:lanthionine synthetase C family protein [Streptomyces sp. Je 1-4]|uniref:lanthionine synthetase C family protein n=1 Tax=Streptomyces TaxID=1883 RepID=UPI0021D93285|nr:MULTISPECIES: lanthionine synthetase C family protein [unclassified Streptomyces]UYB39266.1 lanthionine synthetase C family protein [Streptomyces sp. Je 1-4]UZQ35287.1 lanthionine synthetase C family protein [Streptomyces sp. Je 1-4] [Streptomyces sp. Je 1-4 4N24]UZQ42705.1 lanthionine synthetase C family protein [Streptomyces sp. Je 1-4] [Streptomyces sp. Je 1-4 4N24_ara]